MVDSGSIKSGWRKGRWWAISFGLGLIALIVILPTRVEAVKNGAAADSAVTKEAEVPGECGDAADATRPDGQVQLPPGVSSPLSRLMHQDDGCYGPLRADGGKNRRCEPQCIPYLRCRSRIDSCRIGMANGPLTWFSCEERRGNTGLVPQPGSVLILAANSRRKMPTGHGLYVETVEEVAPSLYRLILSHTNYDRRCSLETNVEARFDQRNMTIDFLTGAWHTWGRALSVAGFILGETDQAIP